MQTDTSASKPNAAGPSQPVVAGGWQVDAAGSHARFTARTLAGLVKTPGRFHSLTGSLHVTDDAATGTLSIDPNTIDTGNRMRDRHLRTADFFDVATHPELRYELSSITFQGEHQLRLHGELLVAGTRTALPLDAKLRVIGPEAVEILCRMDVDRVALGLRRARGMVPRTVELDVAIALRRPPAS
jgi:polyisoprenoid-binding protein YceI